MNTSHGQLGLLPTLKNNIMCREYIYSIYMILITIHFFINSLKIYELTFSLPFSLVMIERIYIYTLSYYHHQIGSMNNYPLFRVSS